MMKEFLRGNDRDIDEAMIVSILKLWPCLNHKLKTVKTQKEEAE
jgi:hypothetical protein